MKFVLLFVQIMGVKIKSIKFTSFLNTVNYHYMLNIAIFCCVFDFDSNQTIFICNISEPTYVASKNWFAIIKTKLVKDFKK
jgi:hypothetical protein